MRFLFLLILFFEINLSAQQKPSTANSHVSIVSENFEAPQLGTSRRIWIYLPPDYNIKHKKYPVIYMHDGQNLFDEKTAYSGEWQADEAMDRLYEETRKSAIIIGVDNGGGKRIAELTPYKNEKYGGGSGDKYLAFIVETLKPYIDAHYRTKSSAKNTIIGGSSLGGLISVYAAVKYPNIFGKTLAFSPAFWINSADLHSFILNSKSSLRHQKFYFVQGKHEDSDIDAQTLKIIKSLESHGAKPRNIYFRSDEDGKHNEMYWRREFPAAVRWLLN